LMIHNGERRYGCAHCNAKFSQKQQLVCHDRTLTHIPPLQPWQQPAVLRISCKDNCMHIGEATFPTPSPQPQ
jgi:hypothetical protein